MIYGARPVPLHKRIWAAVQNALFPPLCLACTSELSDPAKNLCGPCSQALTSRWQTLCPVCEKQKTFNSARCAHLPGFLDTVSYFFLFEQNEIRRIIHALKYHYIAAAAHVFAPAFEKERLNILRIPADIVVPLPLHPRRERERGFNQAELIASYLAGHLDRPLVTTALKRTTHAKPQVTMRSRAARMRNVRDVFTVRNAELVRGRTVLVVDDVTTTGATLEEAARVLKNAGAAGVHGFVLARDA